ncbi:penicillin-binding protein [Ornithinicoccus halotolerans]|uniref:penicillin-binding protein n=1 Tax=Ornithinicoccus halotolerans TaxID=1748220 RepID=UPI00129656ED|nr:penicillin-binding protein [Ornithinicoccus halotolerans]
MRTATTFARVMSLLGAFVAISVLMGLIAAGIMLPVVGAAGTAARESVTMFEELPGDLERNPLAQQSRILTANGQLISTPAQENRILVELEDVAPVMRKAQIAIEDERFYEHGGADLRALTRALVTNATSDTTQGGSTLTQQYVKMMLMEEARREGDVETQARLQARSGIEGYVRKLRELKYAITLEQRLSKDEILEGYLNTAYYGDRSYGIEAAARHYYGVNASELNLNQAATLAGVVRAPGTTDPRNNPQAAKQRRNVVLDRMFENGMINEKRWRRVRNADIKLNLTDSQQSCMNSAHPYFCDYVTEWLLQNPALGETREERELMLTTGGLTIETTLDPELSRLVAQTTREFVPRGNEYNLGSAAAVIEPGTGEVLAIGQSSEYSIEESEDRVTRTAVNWSTDERYGGSSGFGIGSVAKAYTLVEALSTGFPVEGSINIEPAVPVDDEGNWANPADPGSGPQGDTRPAVIYEREDFQEGCTLGEPEWAVRNAEDANHQRVMELREATASSVNTAFAALASQVGTCDIRDRMSDMGLTSGDGDAYGAGGRGVPPTFVLGADAASPLTVASSYATIAAGGLYCPPVPVAKVTDADGKEIPLELPECRQVIDPDVAAGTAELMQEVVSMSGSGFRAVLEGDRPAGGKTGTADRSVHTWFAGYTPQLSAAVWVGYPGGVASYDIELRDITLGDRFVEGWLYGSKLAAPMWKELMDAAHEGMPVEEFDTPSDAIMEGELVTIPDVTGLPVDEAIQQVGAAGFTVEKVEVSSGQPAGHVAYTSPGSGSQARTGSVVEIRVSSD